MNEKQKAEMVQKIFKTLQRQKFADWYNKGRFDAWLRGDLPGLEDTQILEDIQNFFQL